MASPADKAAQVLRGGGVIAYPTEGVFGLGCLPDEPEAIDRILAIKQRDASMGLILIAANSAQFESWIKLPNNSCLPEVDPDHPVTWIVPSAGRATPTIRGKYESVAVRVTSHPVAAAICLSVQSPVVSSSANLSGHASAIDSASLHRQFDALVDYIVPGDCGPSNGPSQIRILSSGEILRPWQAVSTED